MTKARVTVSGSMVDDVIADIVCFSAFEGINRELGKLLATGGARACMYLCLSHVSLVSGSGFIHHSVVQYSCCTSKHETPVKLQFLLPPNFATLMLSMDCCNINVQSEGMFH